MTDDPRIRHNNYVDQHILRQEITDSNLLYCKALLEQVQTTFSDHFDTISKSEGKDSPRKAAQVLSEELPILKALTKIVFQTPKSDKSWQHLARNRSIRVGGEWAIDLTKVAIAELGLRKLIEYYAASPDLWTHKELYKDSLFLDLVEAHLKLGPLPLKFSPRITELSKQGHVRALQNKTAAIEKSVNENGGSVMSVCHFNPPAHETRIM